MEKVLSLNLGGFEILVVSFVKWETGTDFFSQQFTLNFLPDILEASVTPFITPILKSLVVPVI